MAEGIDWINMEKALQQLPWKRTTRLLKHVSGYCATGKQMKRWKKHQSDECPLCPATEDHHHVIQCQSDSTTTIWKEYVDELQSKLYQLHTPSETVSVITSLIDEYRLNSSGINIASI